MGHRTGLCQHMAVDLFYFLHVTEAELFLVNCPLNTVCYVSIFACMRNKTVHVVLLLVISVNMRENVNNVIMLGSKWRHICVCVCNRYICISIDIYIFTYVFTLISEIFAPATVIIILNPSASSCIFGEMSPSAGSPMICSCRTQHPGRFHQLIKIRKCLCSSCQVGNWSNEATFPVRESPFMDSRTG